ncbi:MAG: DUF3093 domain-containing protein [Sciscionella sp.]
MSERASVSPGEGGLMSDKAADPESAPMAEPIFTERLYIPWRHWILPLVAAGLLAAEVHMGYPGVRSWLPYLITVPIAVAFLVKFGNTKIVLTEDELWVGTARLPVDRVGTIEALADGDKRRAMGPELDPLAFVLHHGWIPNVLRIELLDPADPTPYWIFSVRHADALATLLAQRRSGWTA